jgi:hypothetical protein
MEALTWETETEETMHIAQCKKCLTTATVADGDDVHEAVDAAGCTCCPVDHHHGQAAEGGVPCRPLAITLLGPVKGA